MSDAEIPEVNLPFSRIPRCPCDKGAGEPPTKLAMLKCRLRGGPCSEPATDPAPERAPATADEALVELAAHAVTFTCDYCRAPPPPDCCRVESARAVLAAVAGPIRAAALEEAAKVAEQAINEPLRQASGRELHRVMEKLDPSDWGDEWDALNDHEKDFFDRSAFAVIERFAGPCRIAAAIRALAAS